LGMCRHWLEGDLPEGAGSGSVEVGLSAPPGSTETPIRSGA
jgi:hypothetical protein